MLKLHKENIKEMKITGYGRFMNYEFNEFKKMNLETFEDANSTSITQYVRFIENRKVFFSMNKELIACIELTNKKFFELHPHLQLESKALKELNQLAYRIFFFGYKSELLLNSKNEFITLDDIKIIIKYLDEIAQNHKETFGDNNKVDGIKIYIKYKPFTGHENRLGHYYRHLYSIVKYVTKKEKQGLFDYERSREYLKLVRSQMSNDEQLMLYYNFIFKFGKNWDSIYSNTNEVSEDKKSKGLKNQFFTKYRMLHNIPIDRIYDKVEKPQNYFKLYNNNLKKEKVIKNHKIDEDDNLFEWLID